MFDSRQTLRLRRTSADESAVDELGTFDGNEWVERTQGSTKARHELVGCVFVNDDVCAANDGGGVEIDGRVGGE